MHLKRTKILKVIVLFVIILMLSTCIEYFYFNYHALRYPGTSIVLDTSDLMSDAAGFELVGDSLVPTKKYASVTYKFTGRYVDKLIIEYESSDDAAITLDFASVSSDGKPITLSYTDTYDQRMARSVTNIGEQVHAVTIALPSKGMHIKSVSLLNEVNFNVLRFLFMTTVAALFAFILFARKIMSEQIGLAFLITALFVGVLMIIMMPLKNPVTWDDDTHFEKIYKLSFAREVQWTQAAYDYRHMLIPEANTIEEKEDVMNLLNNEDGDGNIIATETKGLYITYNSFAYLPQASMISLARHLNMPFTSVLIMARLGGLIFYALIISWAIAISKFGKRIIAVIAIMPTPLFMAANFSYDPFIICLSILAFSVFTTEYFDHEHKLGIKNTIIFLGSIILASCTKAIYIPLIFLFFFLPEKKFYSRKNMHLFRAGIILIFLTVLATFLLPTLLNPSAVGDVRGGATSVSGQLEFIFSDPVFFARLLLESIWNKLGFFLLGTSSYTNMAYLGEKYFDNCAYLTIIVILFTVFTDARKDDKYTFKRSTKIAILVLSFAIICLIWTALYVAFTPVGMNSIGGVQTRYYLPLMVPLLFMVRNNKIETRISELSLNRFVFAVCIFISFVTMYNLAIVPFNF